MIPTDIVPIPALILGLAFTGLAGAIQVGFVVPLKNKILFPLVCCMYSIPALPCLLLPDHVRIILYTCVLAIALLFLSHWMYCGSIAFHIYNFLMQYTITIANCILSFWLTVCLLPSHPSCFTLFVILLSGLWLGIMYYLHIHVFTLIPVSEYYYRRSLWHCVFAFMLLLAEIFYSAPSPDSSLTPFLVLCSLAVIAFSLWGITDAKPNMLMEKDLQHIEMQNARLSQQVKDQLAFSNQLRIMRHDHKHQLHILHQLLETSSYERALAFIDELLDSAHVKQTPAFCENPIINTILSSTSIQCEKNGVQFRVSVRMPEDIRICDSDLSSLLMNIFNNAIESCQRIQSDLKGYIQASIFTQNDYLVIKCENAVETMPVIENGWIRSSKDDPTHEHGIGLESINRTCKKYDGQCTLFADGQVFRITALLKNAASTQDSESRKR